MSQVRHRGTLATLHIDIDGEWLATEMEELLDVCVSFYYIQVRFSEFSMPFAYGSQYYPALYRPLETFRRQIKYSRSDDAVPLQVVRVNYGSPGVWSLVGVLTGIKPLYDVLNGVRDRSIDTQLKKATLKKLRLENTKTKLEIEALRHEIDQTLQKERFELFQMLAEHGVNADIALREYYPEVDEKLVFLHNLVEDEKLTGVHIEYEEKESDGEN